MPTEAEFIAALCRITGNRSSSDSNYYHELFRRAIDKAKVESGNQWKYPDSLPQQDYPLEYFLAGISVLREWSENPETFGTQMHSYKINPETFQLLKTWLATQI